MGDGDRYCCENRLNCFEVGEVNDGDDDDDDDNKNNNIYLETTVCWFSSLFSDGF